MPDNPRLPPAGSYEVGYRKPPKDKRFKEGQSGNPRGRPKGAKNKAPITHERLKSILVSEAYREVEIQDKTGPVTITMAEAAMRSLAVKAAKGQIGAQKLFLSSLSAVESEEQRKRLKSFDDTRAYQKKMRSVIQSYRDRGEEPPEILPHPDDIELDLETAEVIFHGPVSVDDKVIWMRLHSHKEHHVAEIDDLKYRIKALAERDSAFLEAEEIGEDVDVEGYIVALTRDLEFAQFILITTCLSIMRRWTLRGKQVTKNFALQGLLDQHIANGTNPKWPKSCKPKPIDWEEWYKKFG